MAPVTQFKTRDQFSSDEWHLRVDLAAAFRLAARMNWHEAVANHFSAALSADGRQFLMNPRWKHFSCIKASELLLLDSDDAETMSRPNAPDPSAWCIHANLHAKLPQARCVLHLHPPYATVLASLADPEIKPIDQNTARFFNRVMIDKAYGGIAHVQEEGERIASALGNQRRMIMGNHGVLVAADSVAAAFDDMFYLERACQTLVLAYSTGRPLNFMSSELAERTALDWQEYSESAVAHFAEMKKILDETEPSYAQ
jgi:ribulose-5-phosphate 4-epimerase/fuculose-1-phosphate aldolase